MLTLAFNIQPAEASGTIYIRADGSIDPSTANITSLDNVTYTFTDDISESIWVERDNIIIDGANYILQGTGSGRGIYLVYTHLVCNVTIKNTNIKNFNGGILLRDSSNIKIVDNNITENNWGITLAHSSNNIIVDNNIANNQDGIDYSWGVWLDESSNNAISGNTITANKFDGIYLTDYSNNNIIVDNNIANNGIGIRIGDIPIQCSNNSIYHNNFVNNIQQVKDAGSANAWDDGYPSGGNYWSNYNGTDLYSGPSRNETGYDWIGDTPYIIDENNQDNYPLMNPYDPEKQETQVAYRILLGRYNDLLSDMEALNSAFQMSIDDLHDEINSVNSTQTSNQEAIIDELGILKTLLYVFMGITVVLIATTVYLAIRKPKISKE